MSPCGGRGGGAGVRRSAGAAGEDDAGGTHPVACSGRAAIPEAIAALGQRLYEAVLAHPGETMTVLARHAGASPRERHRSMTQLKRAGRIRSVGERDRTRYFPMAD